MDFGLTWLFRMSFEKDYVYDLYVKYSNSYVVPNKTDTYNYISQHNPITLMAFDL
jgi:hypothetical protein